jgi:hypothetical protein
LLEANCVMCHGHRPRLGAPISLTDAASFQAQGMSGLPLQKVVAERVQSHERPMPPKGLIPIPQLTPLLTWLDAGAARDPLGCAVLDPGDAESTTSMSAGAAGAMAGAAGQPATQNALTGAAWTMFGGDLANTRANLQSPRDQAHAAKRVWVEGAVVIQGHGVYCDTCRL